ncbi:MAG: Gfo/Idh/MocA family protein [Catenisphaera adipataccumulans]|jgi:predicted dehydrogenase|uniref:Gfo/Idh/MocA family protein n=1 Tax=Catenisphaera adipataccumulans TaxID=700500 RepID=UPI003D8DB2A3
MSYNWGIVGTGWIAHEMGDALKRNGRTIYGVCSGHVESARKYAQEYDVKKVFENVDAMVADDQIDIIYIATPHSAHYAVMKKALEAGKHVFCEKAITLNSRQLEECVAIAEAKGLVISDGVTLFHMPLFKKLKEIIRSQELGKVKMIQVNFGSNKEFDPNNRFFNKSLAGGALLDIGVYATSFVRYFMSSKPNVILTTADFAPTGVDETSGILLKNEDDEMAVISLTLRAKQPKRGIVACENGYIEVMEYPRACQATITRTKASSKWSDTGKPEVIEAGESQYALDYELQDMEQYVTEHDGKENLQNIRDVMAILTAVRNQWGMKYDGE